VSQLAIAAIIFACCFCAGLLGLMLHRVLPDQHLDGDSKDTVKLVMGLIATIAALVLSLLVASAKSSYDAQLSGMEQLVADIVELDQKLSSVGPETREIRQGIRATLVGLHERIWSTDGVNPAVLDPRLTLRQFERLETAIRNLPARTDAQQADQKTALEMASTIARTRLVMFVETGTKIPTPFLVILVAWVGMLFLGFGLFARVNPTVTVALMVGSLCVAAAVFLILELNSPFSGLLRLPDAPVQYAISRIGE